MGKLRIFVQVGIEQAIVGGEDDDEGEGDYSAEEEGAEQSEERFIARKRREAMGRRSSLRDPVHKKRAQERAGSLRSE